jgi:cob(I)alamin adenosyltransferase
MTALGGGQRVPKDNLRVQAYGSVDELNSAIGVALAHGLCDHLSEALVSVQNTLFDLGSDLCFLEEDKATFSIPHVNAQHVEKLEALIDELNAAVGPLENFILPGGSVGASHLHVARTICRRAERETATLAREEPVGEYVLPYLNRLSDALFTMARYENLERDVSEPLWRPGE